MKVTGDRRDFFIKKEKEPKRKDAISIKTFRQKACYRTELWRALYKKAPTGQFLIFGDNFTEFTKKSFPDFLGRIFQVKRQSKEVISLFYHSVFFYFAKNNISNQKLEKGRLSEKDRIQS